MLGSKSNLFVVLVALLLMLAGCAFGRHMSEGDQRYAEGDYTAAARSYELALDEKPDSVEAQDKLSRARKALAGEYSAEAQTALKNEDWIGAVATAAKAHRELPENQGVRELVDEVAKAVAAKSAALEASGDFANSLMLLRMVADSLPPATSEYGPRADALTDRWVEQLTGKGTAAKEAGQYGSALLYFAKAARLSSDPTLGGTRDTLRRELLEAWAYRVVVTGKDDRAKSAIGMLKDRIEGTALRIGNSKAFEKGEVDARIEVRMDRPRTSTDRDSRTESVRYQSGTKEEPNPFYKSRQDELSREERELTRVQNNVTKLESDVDRYRNDVSREGPSPNTSTGAEQNLSRAESSLRYERDKLMRQRDAVQRARERLANEQPTKTVPVYSTLEYLIETHTKTTSSVVQIDVEHTDKRKPIASSIPVQIQVSDETHGAYPEADIRSDPLDLPSTSTLEAQLISRGTGAVGSGALASFRSWRTALLERALAEPDTAKRTDLLAIYVSTDPSNVDPKVPVELKSETGISDVVSTLTPGK